MLPCFLKMFLWNSRMQFSETCQNFLPEVQNFLTHHPKWKKKLPFFSQMITLDTYKAVPTELPTSNWLEFRNVSAENLKKRTRNFSLFSPQLIPMKGLNSLLTNDELPMFFFQIDQRPYAKNPKSKQDKLLALPETLVLCKSLLWPPTMQFRRTCPKFLAGICKKSPFNFEEKLKHDNFFPQNDPVEK